MSELSLILQHMPNADCKSKRSYLVRHYLNSKWRSDQWSRFSRSDLKVLRTASSLDVISHHKGVWNFSNYQQILLIGPISFELKLRRLIPGVRSSLIWRAPPQFLRKWRFQIPHRWQKIDSYRSRLAGLTATCLIEAPHHDVTSHKVWRLTQCSFD